MVTTTTIRIFHIPHNPPTTSNYIPLYRTLRLLALTLSPSSFSSAYAREAQFTDETWSARLTNPLANTFVAYDETDPTVWLSTATLLGPLDFGPDYLRGENATGNPSTGINDAAPAAANVNGVIDGGREGREAHYEINAVFTLPEARRRGLSKRLVERTVEFVEEELAKLGVPWVVSVIVNAENATARKLYESCGFEELKLGDGEVLREPSGKVVISLVRRAR